MKTLIRLILVVLMLPKKVAELIVVARLILKSMTGNPRFPNPSPTLAALSAAIDDVEQAQTACKARTKGTAETRNQKVRALKGVLRAVASYVQTVANANSDDAEGIIQSAGMKVKRIGAHPKNDLQVKQGKVSGQVVVTARKIARPAMYDWQYSLDEKTWIDAGQTFQAKTHIANLTPRTLYWFRFRAQTRHGTGDWSDTVTFDVR